MNPPLTPKRPVTDNIHNQAITDNYRWLEDDNSKEVLDWTDKQNEYTKGVLAQDPQHQTWVDEVKQCFDITIHGIPHYLPNRIFWQEKRPGQNQFVVYTKSRAVDAKEEVIIDPNLIDKDGLASLDYWINSPLGNYVNYGISRNGDEMATMYIYNIKTKAILPETIPYARYSNIVWMPDESGFFYTRQAAPGTVPEDEENYRYYLLFHRLGENISNDRLIWGKDRPKTEMILYCQLSEDGQNLLLGCSVNWTRSDVFLYNYTKDSWTTVVENYDASFSGFIKNNCIYLTTNYQAEKSKLIRCNLDHIPEEIDGWETIIASTEDQLQEVYCTSEKIVIEYLHDVCSVLKTFDFDGHYLETINLPAHSSVTSITSDRRYPQFYAGVLNLLHDAAIYFYDGQKLILDQKPEISLSAEEYESKQVWFTSKDGTKVPMFIVCKKDLQLDHSHPTVLYGYGGFATLLTPFFPRRFVPMLKRNGIFAIANIRGGGEFGRAWHQGGILENKTKSFEDLAAAAEYLQAEGYTSPQKLIIQGGSNGGLLVAVTAVLNPQLFRGVICQVPLTDMVRFPQFLIAARWVHEYGNPEVENDFQKIMTWSPYHNVKTNQEYPHFLITTGKHDTRVAPLHARKMAAELQAKNPNQYTLLRTEESAGHGPGRPIQQLVEEIADMLSFITVITQ